VQADGLQKTFADVLIIFFHSIDYLPFPPCGYWEAGSVASRSSNQALEMNIEPPAVQISTSSSVLNWQLK
jgi:hypothetical protein